MAVAFQSVATTNLTNIDGSAKSITITKPTGLAAGDLLVAVIGMTIAEAQGTITGWTSIGSVSDGSGGDETLYVYSKTADSTDASATNFTFLIAGGNGAANDYIGGALLRISGTSPVASVALFDNGNHTAGGTTHTYSGGVSPLSADQLLVMGVFGRHTGGAGVTVSNYAVATSNPTWTERFENSVNSATDYTIAVATAPRAESTATGDFSADFNASVGDSVGILFAVIEAQNVTVSPAVITMTTTVHAPTIIGSANVSPAVITMTATVQAPTVTTAASEWINTTKSSSGSITNTSKS